MPGKKTDEKTEGLNLPFDDEKLVEISIKEQAISNVAATLEHSRISYNKDITAKYSDLQAEETWSTVEDSFDLESAITVTSYKKSRLSNATITELCKEKELNENEFKVRYRVQAEFRKLNLKA